MDAMSRKTAWVRAFAVVRIDYLGPGEGHDFTVKEVVLSQDEADREAERLNDLRQGNVYVVQATHLFLDGGSHGSTPEP